MAFGSIASLALAGCATPTAARPGANHTPTGSGQASSRGAAGTAALYELRRPAELAGLEGRVYALVVATATRFGRPVPTTDEGARLTARRIARDMLPSGPPPSPLVELAMRSQGLVDPPPHLVVSGAPEGAERELLDQLAGRLERILRQGTYLRAGVGVDASATGERRLVLALFEGRVRFRPLPCELRLGQAAPLDFEVLSEHRQARLLIAEPDGPVVTPPLSLSKGRYVGALRCERRGVYQVEVTGEGPVGVEVLANFPVHCGQPAPREVSFGAAPVAPGPEEDVEREVLRLTNDLRRARGLPSLRPNDAVAKVARQHSQDMREEQFVGHVSPRTGSPADRLRRAGVVSLTARENVARAYSALEALSELQKSPAHRLNLLAVDVDELGVGVAVDRSGANPILLVTQDFIRAGTRVDPAAGPAPIYQLVAKLRQVAGLPTLRPEPDLERLAARYLEQALGATDQRRADASLSSALRRFGPRFQQVEGVLVKVSALEGLSQASELKKRGPTHIGVALLEQAGQVAVFVLLATPR